MMNRIVLFLVVCLTPLVLAAQNPNGNYNPFVDGAIISPAPLLPNELGGKGILGFDLGNTGTDPLDTYSGHHLTLTITLSYGVPDGEDPLLAVSGSLAGHFDWSYNDLTRTYTAVQITEIPSSTSGNIEIAFQVAKNSSAPGANGFNVNITPAPYQMTSNAQNDDAVSTYTFTEIGTATNLAKSSLISVYPNPSNGEFIVDLGETIGRFVFEVFATNGTMVQKDEIDFKGEPVTRVLDEYIPGLYHIHLYNTSHSFKRELIME